METKWMVNSSDKETFVLTPYVHHFSFRNYMLAKVLFIHCFYTVVGIFFQPAYTEAIEKLKLFNDTITPKPVKTDLHCTM